MKTRWFLFWGGICLAAYVAVTHQSTLPSQPQAPTALATTAESDAVNNGANDWLLAHSGRERADRLGRSVGDGCKGQAAFYQGTSKTKPRNPDPRPEVPVLPGNENDAFWNVKCADGRSFVVEVHPNGSGKVLECAVLKALHAGECFKRY
jgi:hypothetical protein